MSTGRLLASLVASKTDMKSMSVVEGRADLGARVTGEARGPLANIEASSAVSRRVVEERSSLCGKTGRWRDDSDIVDRLPGGPLDAPEPPEVGGGDI